MSLLAISKLLRIRDPPIHQWSDLWQSCIANPGEATVKLHNIWQTAEYPSAKMEHGEHDEGDCHILSVLFGPILQEEANTDDISKQPATREMDVTLAIGLLAKETLDTSEFHHVKDLRLLL